MFDKLQEVENRYEEVNGLLCQPEVVADMDRYTKLREDWACQGGGGGG